MPGTVVDREKNAQKIQELVDSDPKLKEAAEDFEKEYQFRKKLVLARKEAGLTQKDLEAKTGLAQRAISRLETDTGVSPSVRTLIKYLGSIGYELDVRKTNNQQEDAR